MTGLTATTAALDDATAVRVLADTATTRAGCPARQLASRNRPAPSRRHRPRSRRLHPARHPSQRR